MTTGRRTSPVPQLNCVGGNACGHFEPDVVQCTNTGFDGSDVQWKCQADLPSDFRFGKLDVYCEGYTHPDDPYVLKGSCGLEYKLHYVIVRRNNQGKTWGGPDLRQWPTIKRQSWIETIYFGAWISIVAFILYSFVRSCLQSADGRGDAPPPYRASNNSGGGHGGGGGGGGGGDWGPGGGWGSGWGNNNSYRNKPYEGASTEGFRPGFWSGVGLGGLGAYMASNTNREQDYGYSPEYNSYSSPSSSSSFFGGNSGGYAGSSSSPSGSSSGPSRSATGYGGTRRR